MERRDFLKLTAAGTGALITGARAAQTRTAGPAVAPKKANMIGMPISVAPLVNGDLDAMFDDMVARAGVNALFPFIFTREASRSGAPAEGHRGGNFATPHMQFYKDSPLTLEDMAATEFGKVDVLARVIPVAAKHGIKLYPFVLEDNSRPQSVPRLATFYEIDHHGRRAEKHPGGPCYNHPGYQNFTLGLIEDYASSYELGGLMWGSERQSGLLNTLSLTQTNNPDPGRTTCFCEFCQKKGRDRGIDPERARQGFGAIETFVLASRSGQRPRDGYFTAFWRLLLNHPEVLAWANLWVTSRHEFQAAIYRKIKSVNPALPCGWHVWHNMSFSPFQRAEENFADLAPFSDFLRPALYNNVAGERFKSFVQGAQRGVFHDLSPEATLQLFYQQLDYREAPYDRLASVGLSNDYVQRETRRIVDDLGAGVTQVWPGIDIDVPAKKDSSQCTPESVGAAVAGVFKGGAHGIVLSRNYAEMKPENLSGAGTALRNLGLI